MYNSKSKRILNNEIVFQKAIELEKEFNSFFLEAATKYISSSTDAEKKKNFPLLIFSATLRKCTLSMGIEYNDRYDRNEDFSNWLIIYEFSSNYFPEFWDGLKEECKKYKTKFAELGKEIIPVKEVKKDLSKTEHDRIFNKMLDLLLEDKITKDDFDRVTKKLKKRTIIT